MGIGRLGRRFDDRMTRYAELVDLAHSAAFDAYSATTKEVAAELWRRAREYRAKAGELGNPPDIGEPPLRFGKPSS
jgi:hypothetical protein